MRLLSTLEVAFVGSPALKHSRRVTLQMSIFSGISSSMRRR
jgi:hypothetical protein